MAPVSGETSLIPLLLDQALDPEREIISVADLRPKRDYLNINDLVDLLCRLAEHRVTGIDNAGSGTSYSVPEIVDMIWAAGVAPKPVKSRDESRAAEESRSWPTFPKRRVSWDGYRG